MIYCIRTVITFSWPNLFASNNNPSVFFYIYPCFVDNNLFSTSSVLLFSVLSFHILVFFPSYPPSNTYKTNNKKLQTFNYYNLIILVLCFDFYEIVIRVENLRLE